MHPLRQLRESGKATAEDYLELLDERVAFHSPIFAYAIEGKQKVAAVFAASPSVRSGGYIGEYRLDERTTFLRWKGLVGGHELESLEVIVDNEQGLVVDRTVAFRPFPAVKLFREAMYPILKDVLPLDAWDYPASS